MTETPDNKTGAEKAAVDAAVAFVSDWLDYWFPRANIPGLSLAIRHGDDLVLDRAWGYADLGTKEKLTPQHIFRIASHSKMFTATAIMKLQEQGKLNLDDPVGKFLPWLEPASDGLKNVTLRQLLSHTAGLPRDGSFSDFWNLEYDFPDEASFREQTVKMTPLAGPAQTDLPFDGSSTPPHEMKYSNWGYGILGQIIEQVSGESYADFVQKNVVEPLELHDTAAEADRVAPQRLVTGYGRAVDDVNPAFSPLTDTHALAAATGFCGTAEDLTHFLVARDLPGKSFLGEAARSELKRQFNDVADVPGMAYGLGLMRQKVGEHEFFGHAGGFPGQVTMTLYDPKLKIAVGLCANVDRAPVRDMIGAIVNAFAFKLDHPEEGPAKQFEGRYQTIRDCYYMMASGDKILVLNAETNNPWPAKPVLLDRAPSGGYTIKGSTGFGHDGEEIVFGPQNGVPGAQYGGFTILKR